jgi:hypothetical protein
VTRPAGPARPARGGGSLESAITSASVHQTQQGFHLWHRDDVGNSIRQPWNGSGGWWWLVTVRRFGRLWVSMPASSGAPPLKVMAPKGAAVFSDPSGMVDSAWAVAHWCDGELHTVARVLTIAYQNSP